MNVPSTDHGEFGVASGVDPKRIDVAVKAIMDEFKRLKKDLEVAIKDERILLITPPRENKSTTTTQNPRILKESWEMGRLEGERFLQLTL